MTFHPFAFQHAKPHAAILMSGSGTNAEKLLESLSHPAYATWTPSVILTDNPEKSRAKELSEKFHIPLISNNIREFYKSNGETRVSLMTERGREIREKWTALLREQLKPFQIDFIILAGFVPLTNLTNDYPSLNIHPGDLTCEQEGKRLLTGLHTLPIENATLLGHTALRSSVIIAQAYSGRGGEMDSGPILGISPEVPIDFQGKTLADWKTIHDARPTQRPVGGYRDEFEAMASLNQDRLKEAGDWVVFPPAVSDFAAGCFALDDAGLLCYKVDDTWVPVQTVVYGADGSRTPIQR